MAAGSSAVFAGLVLWRRGGGGDGGAAAGGGGERFPERLLGGFAEAALGLDRVAVGEIGVGEAGLQGGVLGFEVPELLQERLVGAPLVLERVFEGGDALAQLGRFGLGLLVEHDDGDAAILDEAMPGAGLLGPLLGGVLPGAGAETEGTPHFCFSKLLVEPLRVVP